MTCICDMVVSNSDNDKNKWNYFFSNWIQIRWVWASTVSISLASCRAFLPLTSSNHCCSLSATFFSKFSWSSDFFNSSTKKNEIKWFKNFFYFWFLFSFWSTLFIQIFIRLCILFNHMCQIISFFSFFLNGKNTKFWNPRTKNLLFIHLFQLISTKY